MKSTFRQFALLLIGIAVLLIIATQGNAFPLRAGHGFLPPGQGMATVVFDPPVESARYAVSLQLANTNYPPESCTYVVAHNKAVQGFTISIRHCQDNAFVTTHGGIGLDYIVEYYRAAGEMYTICNYLGGNAVICPEE